MSHGIAVGGGVQGSALVEARGVIGVEVTHIHRAGGGGERGSISEPGPAEPRGGGGAGQVEAGAKRKGHRSACSHTIEHDSDGANDCSTCSREGVKN